MTSRKALAARLRAIPGAWEVVQEVARVFGKDGRLEEMPVIYRKGKEPKGVCPATPDRWTTSRRK